MAWRRCFAVYLHSLLQNDKCLFHLNPAFKIGFRQIRSTLILKYWQYLAIDSQLLLAASAKSATIVKDLMNSVQ
jgi:hypothetical protein